MDLSFFLGISLAIPLAVAANLLTPRIQTWIEVRSKRAALQKTRRLREEYEQIKELKEEAGALSEFLLMALIRIALIGAIFGVMSGSLYAFGNLLLDANRGFYAIAQLTAVLGSLIVLSISMGAAREHSKVRNFSEYESFVNETLRDDSGSQQNQTARKQ